jgi:hypothetical protein
MKKSTISALAVLSGIVICSLAFTMSKHEQTKNNDTTVQQPTPEQLLPKDCPALQQ